MIFTGLGLVVETWNLIFDDHISIIVTVLLVPNHLWSWIFIYFIYLFVSLLASGSILLVGWPAAPIFWTCFGILRDGLWLLELCKFCMTGLYNNQTYETFSNLVLKVKSKSNYLHWIFCVMYLMEQGNANLNYIYIYIIYIYIWVAW